MKKTISLVLCLTMILSIFAGCNIKEVAEITNETSKEITIESSKGTSSEKPSSKETSSNNPQEIPAQKNDSSKSKPAQRPVKNKKPIIEKNENEEIKPTTEFYDFMTLDPDVDIENEQVRKDIYQKIFKFADSDDKDIEFTKKEIYSFYTYKKSEWENSPYYVNFHFGIDKKDFYSIKTKEKLENLGFSIRKTYDNVCTLDYTRPKNEDWNQYVNKLDKALIILLQDYNVPYAEILASLKVD